ncbi:MAG: TGS domain-containing protein, partial [Calditrichia bacterium]|nr:TGS domain-containing protein [Calditrichia bacterium]
MSKKINITFPDGSNREFDAGVTSLEIANSISRGLSKAALGAVVEDKKYDLSRPINNNAEVKLVTFNEEEGKDIYWHSSAHVMAQAVKRIWPQADLGIGPTIENGFYYDIDLDKTISPEDFLKIEKEMGKIVDENHQIERKVLEKNKAIALFKERKEELKIELIEELEEEISVYKQGEFVDLCRGPHLPETKKVGKNFKLLSVA